MVPAQPTARAGRSCWPRPVKTENEEERGMEGEEAIWACAEMSGWESLAPTMLGWVDREMMVRGCRGRLLETAG